MAEDSRAAARRAVHDAHLAVKRTADDEATAVRAARAAGATWQQIADALGIRQPNAVRKYGPLPAGDGAGDVRDQAVAGLRGFPAARRKAAGVELRAVASARNADVTWQEIADAVGMLQPNAVQKFRPLLEVRRTVTVRADLDVDV